MFRERNWPFFKRLWVYQAERFPLFKHGLLIAAFASSAVCISALLRETSKPPSTESFLVAFVVLLGIFFQLRVADEYKDADTDAKTRPERAVPRGLIKLRELAVVAIISALIQLVLIILYDIRLLMILLLVWTYLALMTGEFFIKKWLRAHLLVYMLSHMLIMPLIDLFATACDWLPILGVAPAGLSPFLIVSLFNGIILEIGRKNWAPRQERVGVESYSSAWGLKKATIVWLLAVFCSYGFALLVANDINFLGITALSLAIFFGLILFYAYKFIKQPIFKNQKALENLSGVWILAVYLNLGLIPMGLKIWI